jgi:hypothetical protein
LSDQADAPDLNAALLQEILAELRALPAAIAGAIAAEHRAATLSAADRAALATLLPAIAAVVGARSWTARDLLAHARLDNQAAILLRAAITGAAGKPDDSGAVKRLGKLLARAEGFVLGDLLVARIGPVREGTLWTIRVFQTR